MLFRLDSEVTSGFEFARNKIKMAMKHKCTVIYYVDSARSVTVSVERFPVAIPGKDSGSRVVSDLNWVVSDLNWVVSDLNWVGSDLCQTWTGWCQTWTEWCQTWTEWCQTCVRLEQSGVRLKLSGVRIMSDLTWVVSDLWCQIWPEWCQTCGVGFELSGVRLVVSRCGGVSVLSVRVLQ